MGAHPIIRPAENKKQNDVLGRTFQTDKEKFHTGVILLIILFLISLCIGQASVLILLLITTIWEPLLLYLVTCYIFSQTGININIGVSLLIIFFISRVIGRAPVLPPIVKIHSDLPLLGSCRSRLPSSGRSTRITLALIF
jgi:hypothetical protein